MEGWDALALLEQAEAAEQAPGAGDRSLFEETTPKVSIGEPLMSALTP